MGDIFESKTGAMEQWTNLIVNKVIGGFDVSTLLRILGQLVFCLKWG